MIKDELATLTQFYTLIIDFFVNYSFQVIGAIIILIIGLIIARWVGKLTLRVCLRHNVDVTLSNFISSTVKLLLIAMVAVICLGKFGISVAPFIAAIGAVSLSIGLALQGVFSNYGAGFTIILTRPFVVGNTIRCNDVCGVVEEIRLAYTQLSTEDGEIITIPNKHIVGEVLINSFENTLVEGAIGISYSASPDRAIELTRQQLLNHPSIVKDPAPQVGIASFGDSSVNIAYRYWVPTKQQFELQFQINGAVYQAFREAGVEIPFPQREVTLKTPRPEEEPKLF
ncbi:small conductance mechanosensitive channel [Amphritea atlantica]|uniref:Small-conductance mechanosensitive channel n=1 Tax=Amphritea atlantica TaxID=355243 RepID=A0A1H9HZ13_9GAMM|nr:mechanosensitive ion channel domain-containing protein [Amphritea atlantica]SEQ67590.1 small conductance mechanosensitive channel [Amphritea atlantica]